MTQALLVIDVQNGMLSADPIYQGEQLLANIRSVLDRACSARVPVIYVQHDGPTGDELEPGTAGWAIHTDVTPQPGEPVVRKTTPDAFHRTSLQDELSKGGIDRLVICGLQSEFCIDTTCRRAFSLGYQVTLVADAHSTYDRGSLSATQIIELENSVLGSWFASLKRAVDVRFG